MSDSQYSIAGIIFLISLLCACGSKPSFDALTSASVAGGDQSAQNDKNKGGGSSTDEEDCDSSDSSTSSLVALCHVDSDGETHQVCTDTSTAVSKYGLNPAKPNLIAPNGSDHLGAC